MSNVLNIVSLISYIVSGISLILALIFWIKFRIHEVIGDLSGRTARKSIAKMRTSNISCGTYLNVNAVPSGLKKTIPTSEVKTRTDKKRLHGDKKSSDKTIVETGILLSNKSEVIDVQHTDLLEFGENVYLDNGSNTTTSLADVVSPSPQKTVYKKLTMIDEIIIVHTSEVI